MKRTILILACLVFSLQLYAQAPFGQKQTISTNTGTHPSVIDSGHLDSDEFMDIVIGTDIGNTIEWYKNNGNGSFTLQALVTSNLSGVSGLSIADLNNDNRNDIIASSYNDGKLVWFENLGSNTFSNEQIISTGLIGASTVKTGDINNDNTIDVAVSSYSTNTVTWYSNNGNGSFGSAQFISNFSTSGPIDFDIADYDNDGDLDAVVAYYYAFYGILLFENDGSGNYTPHNQWVVTNNFALRDVCFGNVDSDDTLEIIKVDQNSNISSYKKAPDGSFTANNYNSSNTSPASVNIKDINDDSVNDLVVGYSSVASTDKLTWFEDANTSGEELIDDTQNDILSFTLNDFDNDGDLDMASISANENHLNWFVNTTYNAALGLESINTISFEIYPNPTSDYLYFKAEIHNDFNISVYDVLGKNIMNTKIESHNRKLDVSNLNKGVYFLVLDTYNTTLKFIKK